MSEALDLDLLVIREKSVLPRVDEARLQSGGGRELRCKILVEQRSYDHPGPHTCSSSPG
jgi:hypothetical protein